MAIRKLLVDTNILIDAFDVDRPAHDDAVSLLSACGEQNDLEAIAPISSFKDMYYILSRLYKNERLAREAVECLMGRAVTPVDLCGSYGYDVLESDEPDFEDALIRIAAEREGADAIVSRDEHAFEGSAVVRMTAEQVLSLLK